MLLQLKGRKRGRERERKYIGMVLLHLPFLWRRRHLIRRTRGRR
jgi:hypothetical protein